MGRPGRRVVHLVTAAQDAVLELGGEFADVVGEPHGVGPAAPSEGLGELLGHFSNLAQVRGDRLEALAVVADVGHVARDGRGRLHRRSFRRLVNHAESIAVAHRAGGEDGRGLLYCAMLMFLIGCREGVFRMAAYIGTDPRLLDAGGVARAVRAVLDRWPVARAWLYGSVARGTQTELSDVDISFEPLPGARIGWDIWNLQQELEEALDTAVDIQTVPCGTMASKRFLAEYDRDRVIIYERTPERR